MKLQAQLKKVEDTAKVTKGAKVLVKKAFGEATIAMDETAAWDTALAKLRVLSVEKELAARSEERRVGKEC